MDVEMADGSKPDSSKAKASYASADNSRVSDNEESYGSDGKSDKDDNEGLTLEEKLKREQRDKDFDNDCDLMAGLFKNDESRA